MNVFEGDRQRIQKLEQLVWDAHRSSIYESDGTWIATCWGCNWNTSPTYACDIHSYDHDNDQCHPDCYDDCEGRLREPDETFDTMDDALHAFGNHVEDLLR